MVEGELVPLSAERRAAYFREKAEQQADALGPRIALALVEPIENIIAQRFNQPLVSPVAGRVGYQDLLRPENPAAGADFRYTVPSQHVLWPLSVMATFTTSAAAAGTLRSLTLEYQDADQVRYLVAGSQATLDAGQTNSFCWQPEAGGVAWPVDDAAIAPLPQQHLYPLTSLVLSIGNAQAADQISGVRISAWLYPTGLQE